MDGENKLIMCLIAIALAGCALSNLLRQSPPEWTTGAGTENFTSPNVSVTIAGNCTNISFRCFQAYMNDSPPDCQNPFTPILTVTNRNNTNWTNITLIANATLPENITIYAQTANYVNPSSIAFNSTNTNGTIIRRLRVNESKNIWMFAYCRNVTDNQSITFNFTLGGG